MFMFLLFAVVMLGVAGLLFGGVGAAAVGAGFLFFPVLILLKIAFFMLIFGFVARAFGRWGHRGYRYPSHWDRERRPEERTSDAQRFEEWHRLAHAREEVDSWAPKDDE